MSDTKLIAQSRVARGSAAVGRLRRTGWLPAVVYSEGRPGVNVQVNEHNFVMLLRQHRSENLIVDLAVEGGAETKVMLKALQHHPITGRILHVDFYEVSMTRAIEIEVPIELVGEADGVVNHGGMIEQVMRTLRLECLPGDLVDQLELDVTALNIGDVLRVKDIAVDASKLTVLDDPEQVVVALAAPRVEEAAEADEAEGAEPEVVTETKDDAEAESAD
ncbi:MAG: 50S ribosomal protein L25 [Lentisphaerae bacterium]|nr:50S ribosomal protein L25 [Lentisphaerota bacterium]